MPENATRLPRIRNDRKPDWIDVIDRYYADSFDARSTETLLESAEAFTDLTPEEQAFHQAHLSFRQLQALADIHTTLKGIERGLSALDPKALAALKHLPGVRKALVVIAKGQEEMLDLLESAPGRPDTGGDEADDADDLDDDDPDADDADGDADTEDAEDGALADAIEDAGDVEEEDHGHGDPEVLIPEVLPAGARAQRRELSAEEALLAHRDGGAS